VSTSPSYKNVIVFDCETKTAISRGAGFKALEVSVAVSYSYQKDEYIVYLENEIPTLIEILKPAELVVGFNHIGFDVPLLKNYDPDFSLNTAQVYDIMKEFEKGAGHRIKLDTLLTQTLGTQKSAHGLQAVEWYKEGEIQKIIDYCKEDVKQTKMLFDYILLNGNVAYENRGKKTWMDLSVPHVYESAGSNLSLF
jgi:DEAD/DEAH box helicase domain-containing protein